MRRHKLRPALLLGALILALVLGVQPVAAVNVTHASGVFGYAVLQDAHFPKQGANCDYKTTKSNGVYPLKDMSVRTTRIYARDTTSGTDQQWVGWRFKIQRDINFDQSFSTLFTSSVMKAEATDTTPATFNRRKWTPAPNLHTGNYRIQVTWLWYTPGSSTTVQGKQVGLIEWYHVQGGGADTVRNNDCFSSN